MKIDLGQLALLNDGWQSLRLGDVASVAPAGTFDPKSDDALPYVGLEHIEPELRTVRSTGSSADTVSSKTRFSTGDVLFGKLRPYLKKVALADRHGVCSTEIIVLQASDHVSSEFLYCLCATPQLIAFAINHSAGTRMPRISASELLRATVLIPPRHEQDWIADLLAAIDLVLERVLRRIDETVHLKSVYLNEVIDPRDGATTIKLGDACEIHSGVSWAKSDELSPGDAAGIGVMGVTNVQRDYAHADGCTWIPRTTKQAIDRLIEEHTILTIRTNGNPDRIGNVHLAPPEAVGHTLSSFLTAITPRDPSDAPFVLRALQSPRIQAAITGATSGSTGLRNIAVTWLRQLEIPWPDTPARREIVTTSDVFDDLTVALMAEERATRRLRRAVLACLLSGERRLPAEYGRLVRQNGDDPGAEGATVQG